MASTDPTREFALDVVRRLKDAGFQALWAGGCVRDLLRGVAPKDYDVATDARPAQVRELFGRRRTVAVGESFGVILVVAPPGAGNVEVATFRNDLQYVDGRRPEGVVFSTPEEDARRRDFTINGMFYDPLTGDVLDYVGGQQDLEAGVVRAIGDAHARMSEDKLRMLRAVRFAAALGFTLDEATASAVWEMADSLSVVSAERIAQELKRMLVDRHRRRALELARELGLLPVVFPELRSMLAEGASAADEWQVTLEILERLDKPGFELAMAALLQAVAAAEESTAADVRQIAGTPRDICRRLRLSNREIEHVGWLLEHRHDLQHARSLPPAAVKPLLAHAYGRDLLTLSRAQREARGENLDDVEFCEDLLRRTPTAELDPPPLLGGNDLIQQGHQPGPQFQRILQAIREAQLNREITTRDEALRLAEALAESPPP
ncbi:MAG: CCA tRNA nucleotidyltransferase, partial [Planctomycetes bacterium]|nr:CCA tRNA nucleotidyltransferase [Planctomycetota bacterium]